MKPTLEQRLQAGLRKVWVQTRSLRAERMTVLQAAVSAADAGELGQEQRSRAAAAAHKLAGSLGIFGLHAASTCARNVEEQFSAECPDARALAQLFRRIENLLRNHEVEGCSARGSQAHARSNPDRG